MTPPGLCETCSHQRQIRTDRGSVFILCQRGLSDPAWPKYPRLPVLFCQGFVQASFVPASNRTEKKIL